MRKVVVLGATDAPLFLQTMQTIPLDFFAAH